METGWRNSFSGGDGSGTGGDDSGGVGQNTNNAWGNIWDISTNVTPAGTCYDWSDPAATASATASARVPEESVIHALLLGVTNNTTFHDARVGSTSVHHRMPADPHMICLKLGKRHYCKDAVVPDRHVTAESSSLTKRGKQQYSYGDVTDNTTAPATTTAVWPASSPGVRITSSPSAAAVARCQVDGCHVALANAKEYYRRHKVCEIHSKSPKVVVLGLQQRFCQQCSRFHGVTEFDEAKRSCRRRLEGHNLRRRKGTLSHSLPQNFPHSHENNCMTERRLRTLPPPPLSKPGCALSLLSSPKTEPWISSDDLSSRCSAALYELIVANRATSVVGRPLHHHQSGAKDAMHPLPETQMWDGLGNSDQTTMKLDLMQGSSMNFGLVSKEKSKSPEEWTDYCWSGYGGSSVA